MTATINRQAKTMKVMPPLLGPPLFTISLVNSAKAEPRFGFEFECEMVTKGEGRAAVDPRVARMKRDVRVMMSFMVVLNILLSMQEWMFVSVESMPEEKVH
jgi:hypothetical protein